jgi:hypothetical protein
MKTQIIKLPIPSAKLSANARCHWSEKARLNKQHRKLAHYHAALQLGLDAQKISGYKLVFYWPDKRRRDKRNASERCKAYEDGISDFLKQDDSEWDFNGVQFGEPDKKEPRVEFHLTTK